MTKSFENYKLSNLKNYIDLVHTKLSVDLMLLHIIYEIKATLC